mgnify:FL=1
MDHQQHGEGGPISLTFTLIFGFISFITIKDAQVIVGFVASGIAIISGIMAIRYYWLAGNEKRRNLKNNK